MRSMIVLIVSEVTACTPTSGSRTDESMAQVRATGTR